MLFCTTIQPSNALDINLHNLNVEYTFQNSFNTVKCVKFILTFQINNAESTNTKKQTLKHSLLMNVT